MWEILCRERDLPQKKAEKLKTRETKYVEINNVVYMELYSGAKMVNEKDLKTKYLRSKNRELTVLIQQISALNILNMLHNLRSFPFKMPFIS
jgi:hypothetical protein